MLIFDKITLQVRNRPSLGVITSSFPLSPLFDFANFLSAFFSTLIIWFGLAYGAYAQCLRLPMNVACVIVVNYFCMCVAT